MAALALIVALAAPPAPPPPPGPKRPPFVIALAPRPEPLRRPTSRPLH